MTPLEHAMSTIAILMGSVFIGLLLATLSYMVGSVVHALWTSRKR